MDDLSPQAFTFLTKVIYQHSRIRLGPDRTAFVSGRLTQRLRELGCSSYDEYCHLIDSSKNNREIECLVDLISTNHTQFFREPEHFSILAKQSLPSVVPKHIRNRKELRVWCAAAASGEEAYSLAIVISEYLRLTAMPWTIVASDISHRMLDHCRLGIYEVAKVQLPHSKLLPHYFLRGVGTRNGFYRVKRELRDHVIVKTINLFQPTYPIQNRQDVIFCRNVMIYFDKESRQLLVDKLFDQMNPGGFLFIGHSESLLGLHHLFQQIGPSVYQRPE